MTNYNYEITNIVNKSYQVSIFSIKAKEERPFFCEVIKKHYRNEEFRQTFPDYLINDFYMFVWFKKGNGTFIVDETRYEIKDNSFFCLPDSIIHKFENINDNLEAVGIIFSKESLYTLDNPNTLNLYSKFTAILQMKKCTFLDNHMTKKLETLIHKIEIHEHRHREIEHSRITALSIMSEFAKDITILFDGVKSESGKKIHPKDSHGVIGRFSRLLEKNYKKHHHVQFYADRLGISYSTLYRIFRQNALPNPKEIIGIKLISEAKRLLVSTMLSNEEIAEDLGFSKTTNFVSFFRNMTYETPKSYRMRTESEIPEADIDSE